MLFKLTTKILKENKRRTIVTILGIMFSSALLFGIGLLFSTVRDNGIKEAKTNYGPYHIQVNNVTKLEKEKIKQEKNIEDIIYLSLLDQEVKNQESKFTEQVEIKLYGADTEYTKYMILSEGRYPKGRNEIIVPKNLFENDKLKLSGMYALNGIEYCIVGVYDKSILLPYRYYNNSYSEHYELYTSSIESDNSIAYITFDDTKNILNKISDFTTGIDRKVIYEGEYTNYEDIDLNNALLDYYHLDLKGGTMSVLVLSIMLIGFILGLFCTFVIYNSFNISVSERKKLFGVLSSVGASKSQIMKSVFMEAFLVSVIGIPLGLLLSTGFAGSIIAIINHVLGEFITIQYQLVVYPLFIILSLFMIIIVVLLSAYRPAKIASLTSPIETIRMNQDYYLNKRKLKSSKIIQKLFGIEGELAYLNMKRNKKRYRITMISIVISIILFIVFSTYINFAITETNKNINIDRLDYDIKLYVIDSPRAEEFYRKLKQLDEINEISKVKKFSVFNGRDTRSNYTLEYKNYVKDKGEEIEKVLTQYVSIAAIDEDDYQKLIQKYDITTNMPILINQSKFANYDEAGMIDKIEKLKIYQNNSRIEFLLCTGIDAEDCSIAIDKVYMTNEIINDQLAAPALLVSDEMYHQIADKTLSPERKSWINDWDIYIKTDSYQPLDDSILKLMDAYPDVNVNYDNYNMKYYEQNTLFLTVKIVLYVFLGFIGLIAVTSMFNTIHTSMELRRGEFATLRSIGIEPTAFKKMILLESIFFGTKSLLYGIIISLGLIFGISKIFGLSYGAYKLTLPFPTTYILVTIVAVITIITITMFYSIRKIRKDNIIETIRNGAI